MCLENASNLSARYLCFLRQVTVVMQRPCLDVTDLGMSIAEIRDRLRQGIPPDTGEENKQG